MIMDPSAMQFKLYVTFWIKNFLEITQGVEHPLIQQSIIDHLLCARH